MKAIDIKGVMVPNILRSVTQWSSISLGDINIKHQNQSSVIGYVRGIEEHKRNFFEVIPSSNHILNEIFQIGTLNNIAIETLCQYFS